MNSILYLGEYTFESYITDCLEELGKSIRINHFTKPSLDYINIQVDPVPDLLLIKCDWEDHELNWNKIYSLDIPRTFISCNECLRKLPIYQEYGKVFNIDNAINNKDLSLNSLIDLIKEIIYENNSN